MDSPDLALVSVNELLDELNKRFDHWVFSGQQFDFRATQKLVTMRKWRGDAATCAGLASQMMIVAFDKQSENETPGYPP